MDVHWQWRFHVEIMANLIFDISNKVTNGKSQLLIRFYDSTHFDVRAKSRIFIKPELWDKSARALKSTKSRFVSAQTVECAEIQSKMDNLRAHILNRYMETDGVGITTEWLTTVIHHYHNPHTYDVNTPLYEYIEKYIEAKHLLHGTAKQYRVLGNHLRLFSQLHYTIFAGRVELNDLKAFEHFIRYEAGKHPKKGAKVAELAQNTVNSKMRSMRALCNYCVSIGVAQSNPFDKFQIKQSIYGTPVWLTIEERDKIYHTHFDNPSLERQKDIFIFQCYVGCRVSDLMQMTAANITDDGFVQYIQHKLRTTNPTTVRVPLTDTALEILERYKPKRKGDPLLPFISPQKYNVTIKKVLEEAGITREVLVHNPKTLTNEPKRVCDIAASHLARRTFTANIFKLTKSERITSALTGHVNGSRAFSRYTDIDDDMKISVIAAIDMKKQ